MKNKTVKRITSIFAIVLVIVFFSSYIIYHLVNRSNTQIKTEFALKETVYKTIDTKCFVIRDEQFIKNNAVGTSVSFVTDGERVARGDTVSVVFNSSDDAAAFLKSQELKKSIEHFEELSGQAQTLKQIVGAFKLKNVETSASKALGFAQAEEYEPAESFDLYDDKY